MSNKPKGMKSKGHQYGAYNQKSNNNLTGNKNLKAMEKINVIVTDWVNGEIVNHIQQLTRKEFNKYNNGIYSVYELGGYKQSQGKIEYEVPKFYWIMRPSIGTPHTHPCTNEVLEAAALTFSYLAVNRA